MERTLAEILPLALGAMISPTGLLFVMAILSGKGNAKRNSLMFVIGSAIFLIVLGFLVVLVFKPAAHATSHPDRTSALIDIGFGILIILIVLRSLLVKKKEKPADAKQHKKPYIVIGFFYMIVNTSTLIPFIAACKIISYDGLLFWENLVIFLVLLVITMTMLSLPVIITYAFPRRSQTMLAPVKGFMSRHGKMIANIVFLAIALYLIAHGASGLMG